jgi:cyclopropane-fatty-acyl-phospholipid synthase
MFEKIYFNNLLKGIKGGRLRVRYWDGETRTFGDKGGSATLSIKDPKVLGAMLADTSLGFGEAYMDGLVDTDDLEKLVTLANKNNQIIQRPKILTSIHKNIKENQQSYIQHHYDLGNEFFKLWLDDSMTYSCAYFKDEKDSLEKAQKQKHSYILKKLQLEKDMRLLDIGSGWGTLLIQAAVNYGVSGLGVTLSQEQYHYAQKRAETEGVSHLISFKLMNFHDLIDTTKKFDRIVSVGMFEHVGRDNYPNYFRLIENLLVDGGISVLHTISTQRESAPDLWLDKYIFPGGYLPTVEEVTHYLPQFGLRLLDYENLRIHYAKTIDEWKKRYLQHKEEIIKLYDTKFFRMWYFWLVNSGVGFRYGDLDLSQFIFTKGINNSLPLTRDHLYTI